MARSKKPIVHQPGSKGKHIWKILQTKRSSSTSGSSQSQPVKAVVSKDEANTPSSSRQFARKSTAAIMDQVVISDSDSDDEDTPILRIQKPSNGNKPIKQKAKEGTKKRCAPGNYF